MAPLEPNNNNKDLLPDLKAFDESKLGVKGVLDSGVDRLPEIFINKKASYHSAKPVNTTSRSIAVIDFSGLQEDGKRAEIIKQVSDACEEWGFFQAINHGIPKEVLEEMIEGAKRFHESDNEVKKSYYSRGHKNDKKFVFISNVYLYSGNVVNWRDTTAVEMNPTPEPEHFPETCREIFLEYTKQVRELGFTFMELLSEAMGLKSDYLKEIDGAQEFLCLTHYYPPCPQPENAVGINQHADNTTFTVLLQDNIGGLQVLHNDEWYDVPHVPGALIINTGDVLQVLSNDKYKSVIHRVQSKKIGPRISVASFFRPKRENQRLYAPIKELLSETNPPIYREMTMDEYLANYFSTGQDYGVKPSLDLFKLQST